MTGPHCNKPELIEFLAWVSCNAPGVVSHRVLLKSAIQIGKLNIPDWLAVVNLMQKQRRWSYGHYALAHFFLQYTRRDGSFVISLGLDRQSISGDQEFDDYCRRQKRDYWGERRARLVSGEFAMLGLSSEQVKVIENFGA